jgi:hypothetical protein
MWTADKVRVTGNVMRTAAAVFLALLCAGCAHAFSGRVDFAAPKGWVHSDDPTAGETWIKPGGSNQSIMAQTTKAPLPPRQPDWKDIKICGNHPAILMTQPNNPDQIWEGVSTSWNSLRYMAVYVRPVSASPDPEAEKAIRSICLKRN